MADIEVHDGSHATGYSALEKAFRNSWTPMDDASIARRVSLSRTHFPDFAPPLPVAWSESPSAASSSSEILVHEGFENITMPPPYMQARALNLDDSGLPPTPPTMHNSDGADAVQENRASPPPIFADDLRNALESKASGLSTRTLNAVSPPTPDPSPPATSEALPLLEQKEHSHFLHPMVAESRSLLALKHYTSSRAESFRTAREDQPLSPGLSISQVHLSEDDTLPEHWLDNTRDLQLADMGLSNTMVEKTPKMADAISHATISTKSSRRKSKHESPPQTTEGDGTDWEKHISYVNPDELESSPEVEEDPKPVDEQLYEKSIPAGLGLSGAGFQQAPQRSAEDVNNMVYKRIREENVKRHSAISANSGAITVGIVVPPSESTPRTLKRQTKCLSLRNDNGGESPRGSFDGDIRGLSYKKIRLPERQKKLDDSPVFESSIRQVSSPARLGPDASNMTALTYASLQDSPSARQTARFQPIERKHTLRHTSHGDRLSNNQSVRRTSLHGSPGSPNRWVQGLHEAEPPVDTPPRTPPKRTLNHDRIGHNVGVKRNSVEGARPSRVLEKSFMPVRSITPPVVAADPEDSPPVNYKLRRFSREERLENNDNFRRTSLGSSRDISSRDATQDHSFNTRRRSSEKTLMSSPEKSYFPTSPRKSLDARFLHPTTTPMSTSQFSDRSDAELCEASGVRLYPHNNDSLVLVQHGSRPVSKGKSSPDSGAVDSQPYVDRSLQTNRSLRSLGPPIFAAQVDPPTPTLGTASMVNAEVDSPLTNPRAAPEPPVIMFIPPTPNEELERELGSETPTRSRTTRSAERPSGPQRRLSLLQKARRYSDSLFVRAGFLTTARSPSPGPRRQVYLSPLWRPQGFWDEFDSDEEYYEDFEPPGTLPKGGDTSDIPDPESKKAGVLPRVMSKRLPGFRGKGGFLVGNSLGIERHGTNGRRHYVGTTSRTLNNKQSAELLKNLSNGARVSRESLGQAKGRRDLFVVPFSGGKRAQWVGTRALRERMEGRRVRREEREAEKRRERLRGQIGGRRVLNE